jgi:hypothetical protein
MDGTTRRNVSRTARLAAFFRERPHAWIDGQNLAPIAGLYAWRTRLSELRRSPFNMRLENRQRTVRREDGSHFTVSEYRYTPTVTTSATTSATWELRP